MDVPLDKPIAIFPFSGVFSFVLQFEQQGIGDERLLYYPTFTLLCGPLTSCRFCVLVLM